MKQPGKLEAPSAGLEEEGKEGTPPSGRSAGVLWRVHQSSSSGLLACYGQSSPFQHDHRTCPIHKADKKAHATKKCTSATIWEAKFQVSKDKLCKLMMVGTELAKEIQEINSAWTLKPDKDKDKDKDKKGKGRGRKKEDAVNEVAAEKDIPTGDAPCSRGPQPGRSEDGAAVNAAPSTSGIVDSPGGIPSRMPGARREVKNSHNGSVRPNAGGRTALDGPTCLTKVPGEGTNPCTQSSFATKNGFDVLQDLSVSIGGSAGPQLGAADVPLEPITHNLQQSLIELLERPDVPSLHAVRRAGQERHLSLKIRGL